MRKIIVFVLFFIFFLSVYSFAQTSTSQMQRNQELLEKEKELREWLDKTGKIYIKDIMVKGVNLLSEDEVREIITPFMKHWLTKDDFQQIEGLFSEVYRKKGLKNQPTEFSFQIEEDSLTIEIKEQLFKDKISKGER